MSAENYPDLTCLATVTVTFNPDLLVLDAQLSALPIEVVKVVVDNSLDSDTSRSIESVVARFSNAHFIHNRANLGLGAAINRGVSALREWAPQVHYILFLDQDSEPLFSSIPALLEAYRQLALMGHKVGCVGPALVDPNTGLKHGFHQCTKWRWVRTYPQDNSSELVSCSNLNGSGTLVSITLFERLRGLDEQLFIDHVDTDWSFRVLASGYELWGVPKAKFVHRMGEDCARFWWLRWRVWPVRSPQRHYFLFRNAVLLMQRNYVPFVWKFWAVIKLMLTALVALSVGPSRIAQLSNMCRGLKHGFILA